MSQIGIETRLGTLVSVAFSLSSPKSLDFHQEIARLSYKEIARHGNTMRAPWFKAPGAFSVRMYWKCARPYTCAFPVYTRPGAFPVYGSFSSAYGSSPTATRPSLGSGCDRLPLRRCRPFSREVMISRNFRGGLITRCHVAKREVGRHGGEALSRHVSESWLDTPHRTRRHLHLLVVLLRIACAIWGFFQCQFKSNGRRLQLVALLLRTACAVLGASPTGQIRFARVENSTARPEPHSRCHNLVFEGLLKIAPKSFGTV